MQAAGLGSVGGVQIGGALAAPRFPRLISARELQVFYTPASEEITWAGEVTSSDESLLGLVLALKCFQRMGRFPRDEEIPELVVDHVRHGLGLDAGPGSAPARCWRQRGWTIPARDAGGGVGDAVGVEYVSRVPRPPLDELIDDLYYLEGAPPYARLTLPPGPSALLIVNLGAPFRIRAGTDIETAEYADGCVVTTPTRALEFGYPLRTRSVGLHLKPWGLAPFLPMPAAELCDRPVTVEQVWGRVAIAELRDRLATADGPHEMLTLLEEELMRRLCETAGLGLVRHTSSVLAATSGAVAIGDLSVAAGVSSTHLAQRFKELIGVTPKRLARTYRFTATVFAINPAGPIDWGDLAGGAGYFDQAHFGHEFRAFTGLTPTRYVEVRRRFLREHPGHVLDGWPLPAD
ncbi:AraC-like DNA-binding protein [Pseudonocardia hierapolitana]|uniref:AraC-like DNA-binding protein n=1 Tax=Pseudonocardia hierapolitana TaxID=1128676 RepID=A0A561SNT2_9PSEU|nr:AraC-like DNA-binding protein [Pseudonocardia hierapolitana]